MNAGNVTFTKNFKNSKTAFKFCTHNKQISKIATCLILSNWKQKTSVFYASF